MCQSIPFVTIRQDNLVGGHLEAQEKLVNQISLAACYCKILIYFLIYSYEPELFPGLIYRMVKPRIVLLIFVSGKVVLTGQLLAIFITNSLHLRFCLHRKSY